MWTSSSSKVGGNKLGVNVAHSFNTQMYQSVLRAFTANICLDGHTTSYFCPLFCQLCPKNTICRGILIDMANNLSTGITILSNQKLQSLPWQLPLLTFVATQQQVLSIFALRHFRPIHFSTLPPLSKTKPPPPQLRIQPPNWFPLIHSDLSSIYFLPCIQADPFVKHTQLPLHPTLWLSLPPTPLILEWDKTPYIQWSMRTGLTFLSSRIQYQEPSLLISF